jgi:hypothetical protein
MKAVIVRAVRFFILLYMMAYLSSALDDEDVLARMQAMQQSFRLFNCGSWMKSYAKTHAQLLQDSNFKVIVAFPFRTGK